MKFENILDKNRLQKLKSLNMLDSGAEEAFDRLTSLACEILDVPISLLSLIDGDRQFFKSQVGLSEPWASLRETPLSHSICQYIPGMDEPLIFEDTRQHELLHGNLAISELNMIAYAGIPLKTSDGYTLGSFCAIDSKPKRWTERDIRILQGLAGAAMTEIELRHQIILRQEAENTLRASEAQFSEIAEAASDAIIVLNEEDKIQFCNRACSRIFGYSKQELLDQSINILLGDQESVPHKLVSAANFHQSGKPHEWQGLHFVGQHKDGHYMPVEASFGSFEKQNVSFATLIIRDISQQIAMESELRASEARYLQILDAIPDFVFVKDPRSRIVWANKALQDYYGMSIDEMMTMMDAPHVEEAIVQAYKDADKLVFQEGKQQIIPEEPMVRHDGTIRQFMTTKTPIFDEDDRVALLVGISRDVTDSKNLERYLTEALETNNALIEMKSSFTSMVSHEFRTPLAVIQSSTDILTNYYERLTDERRHQKLNTISEQIRRLARLMDDVLLVSKGDEQGLSFNPVLQDVHALTFSIIEEIQTRHQDANVAIDYVVQESCGFRYLDSDIFRHIFQNLLSNAVKYSRPGSEVNVRLNCTETDITLIVVDKGIGIPAENQENLYQTFHRASNVGTIQGTGLGLAIVKRAVDTHGGTINFNSIENQGTMFIVKLPATKADSSEEIR